jgi:hypothetical protein
MSLLEKIKEDTVAARKARRSDIVSFLSTLYAEASNIGKNDGNRPSTDEEVVRVVKKFMDGAKEVIEKLPKEDERYVSAVAELAILTGYLPKQMTEAELSAAVDQIITEGGLDKTEKKTMGVVMGMLRQRYAGQYDGKLANEVVKKSLTS